MSHAFVATEKKFLVVSLTLDKMQVYNGLAHDYLKSKTDS